MSGTGFLKNPQDEGRCGVCVAIVAGHRYKTQKLLATGKNDADLELVNILWLLLEPNQLRDCDRGDIEPEPRPT